MKNLESFHKKNKFLIILVFILIPLLVFLPKAGSAFFPLNWSDLNFQMRYQAQWYRVRLENRIEIFDPFENKTAIGAEVGLFLVDRNVSSSILTSFCLHGLKRLGVNKV